MFTLLNQYKKQGDGMMFEFVDKFLYDMPTFVITIIITFVVMIGIWSLNDLTKH